MKIFYALLLVMVAAPAHAQTVPDHKAVVQALFDTGNYDLKTHDGQAIFVDDVVASLYRTDPKWGHLRKRMGQTQIHLHAEDAALYLSPIAGESVAVDFINGAGGPNPSVGWSVDIPRYSPADWWDPTTHSAPPPIPTPVPVCPPVPAKPAYPGDAVFDAIGKVLFADYAEAGQAPNEGMGRWMGRVVFDWIAGNVPTLQASIDKHRRSWRAALGLP